MEDAAVDRRAQKVRFGVALAVFGLWVVALASMATLSGRPPQPNAAPKAHAAP